jgi:hypothetical protein
MCWFFSAFIIVSCYQVVTVAVHVPYSHADSLSLSELYRVEACSRKFILRDLERELARWSGSRGDFRTARADSRLRLRDNPSMDVCVCVLERSGCSTCSLDVETVSFLRLFSSPLPLLCFSGDRCSLDARDSLLSLNLIRLSRFFLRAFPAELCCCWEDDDENEVENEVEETAVECRLERGHVLLRTGCVAVVFAVEMCLQD